MEDLNHLLTFVRVVQAGSFTAGAARLHLAPSVASKHVAKLERELGARLLQRSTRKLSLTEAGQAYYEHCARIAEELEQSREAVARLQAEPGGRLRLSALNSFTANVLAPLLPEFFQRYPKVELEIVNSDRPVDLVEEGFDLALRITTQPGAMLVARPITPIRFLACASADYLARRGTPRTPMDLAQHECLGYPLSMINHTWKFRQAGQMIEVPVHGCLSVNNVETLRINALAGLGIAMLPTYAVAEDLRDGRLVAPIPDAWGFEQNLLYAVYVPNRYGSPKLRAFVEFLIEQIGDPPYWDRSIEALLEPRAKITRRGRAPGRSRTQARSPDGA